MNRIKFVTVLLALSLAIPTANGADRKIVKCSLKGNFTIIHNVVVTSFNCGGEVVIPNSVTTIGESAFEDAKSLKSLTIPNSVTSIGYAAFIRTTSMTSLAVDGANPKFSSDTQGVLYNKEKTILIQAPLAKSSIIIPSSVTTIGESAFEDAKMLRSLTIPNSVTTIGDFAFNGLTSLRSLTIPNSVTKIGFFSFSRLTSLTSFTVDDANPEFSSDTQGVLYNKKKTIVIDAAILAKSTIIIPNSVTTIGDSAFNGLTSLKSLTIPNSVTTIGSYAFANATSLRSLTIPKSVTTMGISAFANLTSLTSLTIGNGVTTIGVAAFYGATSLRSLTIPNSVTTIGRGAFADLASLTSLTIPNSVTTIGISAFEGLTSLSSLTLDGANSKFSSAALQLIAAIVAYAREAGADTAAMKTMTCIKGKLVKKITAVKPKCPSGYKVKR